MVWRWLVVPVAIMAVAALPPVEDLPPPSAQPELPVPARVHSQETWSVRMEPGSALASGGFAAGVARMDGVRGQLHVTDEPGADIVVRWVDELHGGDRLGQYVVGTPRIDIALGDTRCAGGWTPYDEQTIARAVAHEIGHAVGLDHEEGTLMAQRLPASYAAECIVANEAVRLLPLQVHSTSVRIGEAGAVAYDVVSSGGVDVCITPAGSARLSGWGCARSTQKAGAEVELPAGAYRVAIRCVAVLGCDVQPEVATRPASSQAEGLLARA